MPKGHPVTPEQKEYIIQNKDGKFVSQMATQLNLDRKTVRNILKDD